MIDKIKEAVKYIKSKTSINPQTAIVLGSGLGDFTKHVNNPTIINYAEIPHFKPTSVTGHEGKLLIGTIKDHPVIVQQGRLHLYEGHDVFDVVLPIRAMRLLGAKNLFLTNASGGIDESFEPGDLVCIRDHINMMGVNPLTGYNMKELGVRFPDMSHLYNKDLRHLIEKAFHKIKLPFKTGVYTSVLGPSYETPAEVKMIQTLGGDMVGMSTVPEAIAAHHAGFHVAGISCITNYAAGISLDVLDHEDVKTVARTVNDTFSKLILETISLIK